MIYSQQYNFIFIHIPKTGGMSVRHIFENYNSIRLRSDVKYNQQLKTKVFSKHMGAAQVRELLTPKIYDNCFSFAFVRNPWAWLVSGYHYVKQDARDPRHALAQKLNFKDFTLWLLNAPQYQHIQLGQHYFIQENGKFIVSFIGRTERMDEGLKFICAKTKVPFVKHTPFVNKTKHRHYREYYDDDLRKIVENVFENDVTVFNYAF